jgi:hypothetical protein
MPASTFSEYLGDLVSIVAIFCILLFECDSQGSGAPEQL